MVLIPTGKIGSLAVDSTRFADNAVFSLSRDMKLFDDVQG
jgi:hypothetical protein